MATGSPRQGPPTEADFDAAIAARARCWYAACLRITRNPQLAEDALQDAMLRAWDRRHQFEHGAKLETWIHRIAVNSALQLLRKQRPDRDEPLDFEVRDDGAAPDQVRWEHELGGALGAALHRLSEIERICFVLRHLEQWHLDEIAGKVDKSVGSVKQALFRAVRKLREHLPALAREAS
jgi:RNA polymerase sigma-70 factor (ECF subfamily)